MKKYAYLFRLKLTSKQTELFIQSAGCVRKVWNIFLAQAKKNKYASYKKLANQLPQLKQDLTYLKHCPSQALQQSLKNLDKAFKGFFEGRSNYPVFKKKNKYKAIHFPQGFKLLGDGVIFLPKLGEVKFIQHREISANFKLKNVYIRQRDTYFTISLQGELEDSLPTGTSLRKICGFDLGIKHFLVSSDKNFIKSLNAYQIKLNKLQKLQQSLSVKTKHSRSYNKKLNQIRKLHNHIANCRKDFNHKLSRFLANNYDIVICEKLNIQKMLETGSSRLNMQILDQGWYQFITFLSYKLAWLGKKMIQVNPAYTSQTCSCCGHVSKKNRLTQASFHCINCGLTLNADENASLNILRRGLKQLDSTERAGVLAHAITEATSLKLKAF